MALAFVAGTLFLQQARALPTATQRYVVLMLAFCLLVAGLWTWGRGAGDAWLAGWKRYGAHGLLCVSACLLGADWAAWRAEQRLAMRWPAACDGRDAVLLGVIEGLPMRGMASSPGKGSKSAAGKAFGRSDPNADEADTNTWRLGFRAEADVGSRSLAAGSLCDASTFHGVVSLTVPARLLPSPAAGQRWRVTARIHGARGLANFDLPSQEAAMLRRGEAARGYVRQATQLTDARWRPMDAIARQRAGLAARIRQVLGEAPHAGVVAALALGVQAGISEADWARFSRTGTNHLVAVSGLHIGLAAALAAWLVRGMLRLLVARRPVPLILPIPHCAGLAAVGAAGLFALMSGMGVPAQRAFWMVLAYVVLRFAPRRMPASAVIALAAFMVVLADPWSVTSPGFALSFGAVATLLALATVRGKPVRPPVGCDAGPQASGNTTAGAGDRAAGLPFSGRARVPLFTLPVAPGEWRPLGPGSKSGSGRWPRAPRAPRSSPCSQSLRSPAAPPVSGSPALPRSRKRSRLSTFFASQESRWRTVVLAVQLQLALSVALIPMTVAWFGQIPVLGALANIVAIPWVSLLVVPLIFAAMLLPAPLDALCWQLAHRAVTAMARFLDVLAAPQWSLQQLPAPSAIVLVSAIVGIAWLLAPRGTPGRSLGTVLCLPLILYMPPTPPPGEFRATLYDIGQGNAILIETAKHRLLFDTGPPMGRVDAGQRVIVPSLQRAGIRTLDALVVSHAHDDHYGGAESVFARLDVREFLASWPLTSPLSRSHKRGFKDTLPRLWEIAGARGALARACRAGQHWQWDGVTFAVLWPIDPHARASPNAMSCVVRVSNGVHSVLLTGDIEAAQEAALLRAAGNGAQTMLQSTILVVPHHGSGTSSTPAFIDAVRPLHAVFQAGYRNRHGHPAARVLPRYLSRHIAVYRNDMDGAVRFSTDGAVLHTETVRGTRRRYWMSSA